MKRKSWKRTAAFVTSLAMTTTMLPSDLSGFVTSIVHAEKIVNSNEEMSLNSLEARDILYPGATISFGEDDVVDLNYQIWIRGVNGDNHYNLSESNSGVSYTLKNSGLSDDEAYSFDGCNKDGSTLLLHFTVISTASESQLSVGASTEPVEIRCTSTEEGLKGEGSVKFIVSSDSSFTADDIKNNYEFKIPDDYKDIIEMVPVNADDNEAAHEDDNAQAVNLEYLTVSNVEQNGDKYEATVTINIKVKEDCFGNAEEPEPIKARVRCKSKNTSDNDSYIDAEVTVIKDIPEDDRGVVYTLDATNPVVEVRYTSNGKELIYTAEMIENFQNASGVRVPKDAEVTVVTVKKAEYFYNDGVEKGIELISNTKTEDGNWAATFKMPGYKVTNEKIKNDIVLVSAEGEGNYSVSFDSEAGITGITVDGLVATSSEDFNALKTVDYESHVKITSKVRLTIKYTDETEKTATFGNDVAKDKDNNYIYEFDMPLSDVTISKYHHDHDNSYVISEQKNSIVYKCSNKDNECPDPNETIVEIGLNDDKYVYNGKPQGVKLSGSAVSVSSDNTQGSNGSSSNQLGTVSMTPVTKYYAYDAFGDLISNPLSGVPVNAGSYLAKVTVNEKDADHDYNGNGEVDSVELEYNYEIERAPITDSNVVWGEGNGSAATKYGKAVQVNYTVKDPAHDITVSVDDKLDAINSAFIAYYNDTNNFTDSDGSQEDHVFNRAKATLWSGIYYICNSSYTPFSTRYLGFGSEPTDSDIESAIISSSIFNHELSNALDYVDHDDVIDNRQELETELIANVREVIRDALNTVEQQAVAPSLTRNDDYIILGSDTSSEAGKHTFTVRGKGNYTGSVTKEWTLNENGKLIDSDNVKSTVVYRNGVATLKIKVCEPEAANNIDDEPVPFELLNGIDAEHYTAGGVMQVSIPGTYTAYVKGAEKEENGYFGYAEIQWTVDAEELYKSAVGFRNYDPSPVVSNNAERVNVKYGVSIADLAAGTEAVKGLIYCNDGTVTDVSDLTLEAAAENKSIKIAKNNTNGNIKDNGEGVLARAYVTFTYTDKTGAKKTQTIYSGNSVNASYKSLNDAAARASINLRTNAPKPLRKADGADRVVCSFTYNTTKNNVKSSGILYCNDGTVTKVSEFTLEHAKINSSIKQAAGVTNGNIKDLGNGVTAVGYVVLTDEVGNETVIYTDKMSGNFVDLSEAKANEECILRAYNVYSVKNETDTVHRVCSEIDYELGTDYNDTAYEVVNYGLIYCNDGQVGMAKLTFEEAETNKSVKIANKTKAGNIKDNGFGTFVRGFIIVKDSNGYETTIMTPTTVNIGGSYNSSDAYLANNIPSSVSTRRFVYDPNPVSEDIGSDTGSGNDSGVEP